MALNFLQQVDGLPAWERLVSDALPPCLKRSYIIVPVDDVPAKLVFEVSNPDALAGPSQRERPGQPDV